MPESDGNIFEIAPTLKALETRMAAINANWNGLGPDLMSPAQLKNFLSTVLALHEESGKLLIAVGGYAARSLKKAA
jgi:hypothetical protein